jgi:hypothetical protein
VNFFYRFRLGHNQVFITAIQPAEIIGREILYLNIGTHRAVKNDDAVFQNLKKVIHLRLPIADCQFEPLPAATICRAPPNFTNRHWEFGNRQ